MFKLKLLGFFISFSLISISQDFNVGFNVGLTPIDKETYFSTGANIEYRPIHAYFSINKDPFLLFNKNNISLTEPIYLKFIFGKKIRICPSAGGFIRTSGSYGWLLGLHLEYVLKEKFIIFSKNEFYKDYRKLDWPNHDGSNSTYVNNFNSLQFSFGVKIMLKNN